MIFQGCMQIPFGIHASKLGAYRRRAFLRKLSGPFARPGTDMMCEGFVNE